ncbi:MAG: hypothetical protein SGPRY_004380 [Prymnesium sp.]
MGCGSSVVAPAPRPGEVGAAALAPCSDAPHSEGKHSLPVAGPAQSGASTDPLKEATTAQSGEVGVAAPAPCSDAPQSGGNQSLPFSGEKQPAQSDASTDPWKEATTAQSGEVGVAAPAPCSDESEGNQSLPFSGEKQPAQSDASTDPLKEATATWSDELATAVPAPCSDAPQGEGKLPIQASQEKQSAQSDASTDPLKEEPADSLKSGDSTDRENGRPEETGTREIAPAPNTEERAAVHFSMPKERSLKPQVSLPETTPVRHAHSSGVPRTGAMKLELQRMSSNILMSTGLCDHEVDALVNVMSTQELVHTLTRLLSEQKPSDACRPATSPHGLRASEASPLAFALTDMELKRTITRAGLSVEGAEDRAALEYRACIALQHPEPVLPGATSAVTPRQHTSSADAPPQVDPEEEFKARVAQLVATEVLEETEERCSTLAASVESLVQRKDNGDREDEQSEAAEQPDAAQSLPQAAPSSDNCDARNAPLIEELSIDTAGLDKFLANCLADAGERSEEKWEEELLEYYNNDRQINGLPLLARFSTLDENSFYESQTEFPQTFGRCPSAYGIWDDEPVNLHDSTTDKEQERLDVQAETMPSPLDVTGDRSIAGALMPTPQEAVSTDVVASEVQEAQTASVETASPERLEGIATAKAADQPPAATDVTSKVGSSETVLHPLPSSGASATDISRIASEALEQVSYEMFFESLSAEATEVLLDLYRIGVLKREDNIARQVMLPSCIAKFVVCFSTWSF